MRYRVIQEHDRCYPIRLMCRALAVSSAGYYAWRARPESARSVANRALLTNIQHLHRESRQTYGSPRIWGALRAQGHRVGEHRVARFMRQAGLQAKTLTKWRVTTDSAHRFPAIYRRSPESGVDRRPLLYLDKGRLALSGRALRPLFAGGHWVGDGAWLREVTSQSTTYRWHSIGASRSPASCTIPIAGVSMRRRPTSNSCGLLVSRGVCRVEGIAGATPASRASLAS